MTIDPPVMAECFKGPLDGADIRVMEHFWIQLRTNLGEGVPPIRQISLDGPPDHGPLAVGWSWEGSYVLTQGFSRTGEPMMKFQWVQWSPARSV